MRPLIIGFLLFLIWSSLSTWYYADRLFPIGDQTQETVLQLEIPEITEGFSEKSEITKIPEKISLYFDLNKSEILPSSQLEAFLNESLNYLQENANSCLSITGHTCSLGRSDYNLKLGMLRAQTVEKYFLKNGFSSQCLKVFSKGEDKPVTDNTTEEKRKENRRVELQINH